jgi:hypothetical protein
VDAHAGYCRAASLLRPEVCEEARGELGRRVNLWIALRHRPEKEFIELTKTSLEVLSLCERIDPKRVVRFLQGFTDGSELLRSFLECLARNFRTDVLEAMEACLHDANRPEWRRDCLDAWLKAGATNAIDLTARLKSLSIQEISPFASCWLQYHKVLTTAAVRPLSRPAQLKDPESIYRRNYVVEAYLYDLFFWELADGLRNPGGTKSTRSSSTEFIESAIGLIIETARSIAAGRSQLSFSTIYFAARSIPPVDIVDHSDPAVNQYFGFKHALRRIAVDVHLVKQPTGRFSPLSDDELAVSKASQHWVEELWLDEQLERNIPILSSSQAASSIATEIAYLDKHVTVFNERVEKWIVLARFALLYKLPELDGMIRRAANCALGYGWRKDLWINDILDAIAGIHQAGSTRALRLLGQIVPAVDQITEFTDGDETDYCRLALIETTARVSPERLPNFYAHHLEDDDFRYAENALHEHFKISNPDSPVTQALAKTFVENADISVLIEMASNSPVMRRVLDEQIAFLGGNPPEKRFSHGNSADDSSGSIKPFHVEKFKANEFAKLIKKASSIYHRGAVQDWLLHWEKEGQGRQALQSIRNYFDEEDGGLSAEAVLDVAYDVSRRLEGKKAGFYWLVQAQVHRYGWQSFWTSEAEIMARLEKAAESYRADWKKFIFETSVQSRYWRRRNDSFSIGVKYLVRFLLLVGQTKLAAEFTESCVNIVLDEVSDQPLPDCPWFN